MFTKMMQEEAERLAKLARKEKGYVKNDCIDVEFKVIENPLEIGVETHGEKKSGKTTFS